MATDSSNPYSAKLGPATPPEQPPRPKRLWPPPLLWIFLIALAAWNIWNLSSDAMDHGVTHLILMVSIFVGLMTLLVWLAFFSGRSPAVRRKPLVIVLLTIAATAVFCRVDYLKSELWPVLAWRWSPHPDELLGKLDVSAGAPAPQLGVTTENDFPQFLGPSRTNGIDRLALDRDWDKHPPRAIWRQPIGAGHSGFVAVNGFAVTMEQRGKEELVSCYDALTGQPRWASGVQARHDEQRGRIGPRSTPTIFDGRVYALGATGILRCLNGADGQEIWRRDVLAECGTNEKEDLRSIVWGRSASPLIVDSLSLVVVPGGGPQQGEKHSLLAFDRLTGRPAWQGGAQQVGYASPSLAVFGDRGQIVSVNESSITGHDPLTGAELWKHNWPGSSSFNANASQAISVGGNRLFVSKGYDGGASLFEVDRDEKTGDWTTKTIWSHNNILKTKFSNVAIYNGNAYGLSDGILECASVATGKRYWKHSHYGHGQILRVGDLLLVEGDDGAVAMVEAAPEAFHELGHFQAIDGLTWNPLCFWGRYLLVRNSEEAACYELPLAAPVSASSNK